MGRLHCAHSTDDISLSIWERARTSPYARIVTEDVQLYVHADLDFFTARRGHRLRVPVQGPRSAKDAVESVGIPHPEIGRVVVDGMPVPLDHILHGGERVEVHPARPADRIDGEAPPAPDRFVCDVHLGRLARRLRLLGFDTWYRRAADDVELADVATAEDRTMLTRDRGLLMRRVVVHGYCPRSDDPDEQAVEVLRRFALSDRVRPLSRCPRCNGDVLPVEKAAVADRLPLRTRVEHSDFSRCVGCGQIYWPGSHIDRISAIIDRLITAATEEA